MVYLREILKNNRNKILQLKNIEMAAYLFATSSMQADSHDFDLSPDESIALKGYNHEQTDENTVGRIVRKPSVKGISAASNIYKLSGLYLAAKNEVYSQIQQKYKEGDLKQKYFLTKIEPAFSNQLKKDILEAGSDSTSILINKIFGSDISEDELDSVLLEVVKWDMDVQEQILLEDLERAMLRIKYRNKSAHDMIRVGLSNFSNAIQKITKNRRKDHAEFIINDEYDVQDILYVIMKSFFPQIRDEDAIPKQGAKSTKIDLILRDEKILIEVKMLKKNDGNEVEFVEQLKKDIESYHQCQWLETLYCFVYDPFRKTRDVANFMDLNGERIKNGHTFRVEVIISN